MRNRIAMVILLATSGCGEKKQGPGGGPGGAPVAAPQPAAGDALPAAVQAWMPKDAAAAFAGAWAGRLTFRTSGTMSMAGDPAAVEIAGARATVFDGAKEHAVAFRVAAPCAAAFVETTPMAGGGESKKTETVQFLHAGGRLEVGVGAVGLRRGKAAVACTVGGFDGLYVLDDKGACQAWGEHFGRWEAKPATCAWGNRDGHEILTLGEGDFATVLHADGDLLRSEQFAQFVAEGYWQKVADAATARQLTAWERSAADEATGKDPTAGTAGDLATVRGVAASLAADAKGTEGKDAKVTGYVRRIGHTDRGFTLLDVVDAGGLAAPTLTCVSKDPAGAPRWAKVTVAGKVRGGSSPELADCVVTR